MTVTVNIPVYLMRYIEFIPQQDLPDVLLNALKTCIYNEFPEKENINQFSIDELVSLLSKAGLVQQAEPVLVKEEKVEEQVDSKIVSFSSTKQEDVVISKVLEDLDDEDDIADFMDLMK